MVLGHTAKLIVTRLGPVICTDVALSRAFGEKQGPNAAEWVKFEGKNVYRYVLDMNGEVKYKALKTEN